MSENSAYKMAFELGAIKHRNGQQAAALDLRVHADGRCIETSHTPCDRDSMGQTNLKPKHLTGQLE